jgi:hypothetical protein
LAVGRPKPEISPSHNPETPVPFGNPTIHQDFAMAIAGVLAITLHPATRLLFTRMARNLP